MAGCIPANFLSLPALFSDDRRYRYTLHRPLMSLTATRGPCVFILHNCSIADETAMDPTITRCVRYAERFGCSDFYALNRFAIVGTDPNTVFADETVDPVGPLNDEVISRVVSHAVANNGLVIAAWGAFGVTKWQKRFVRDRAIHVLGLAEAAGSDLHALALTADGQPRHPLYLKSNLQPFVWKPRISDLLSTAYDFCVDA